MIIDKNSWHYQVYSFSYWNEWNKPKQTNLCQYVRRIVFMGPIMGATALALACLMALTLVVMLVFGPILGYAPPNWKKPWTCFDGMVKYKSVIYPWHVILVVALIALEWWVYVDCGIHPLVVQGEILGIIAVLIGMIFGLFVYCDSDTGKIINAYVSAKKQKVCPVVEFNEEST